MDRLEQAYYYSFEEKIRRKSYSVPIYKFIPFEFALSIVRNKKLLIGQTMRWEDVYENFLAKAQFSIGGTRSSLIGFLPTFYGQSWTLSKEADALWRIYSPLQQSVRLKTNINKLLGASLRELNLTPYSTRKRVIGQVKYLTNSQLEKWINKQISDSYLLNGKHLLESPRWRELAARVLYYSSRKSKDIAGDMEVRATSSHQQ